MNKSETLKLVNNYLDTQEVEYMTTIYEKRSVRRHVTRTNAQLRSITDGEIVVEYDCENVMRNFFLTRLVLVRLKHNGYNYVVWKSDNSRSTHIHLYDIKGLDKLSHEVNREYKKLFLLKYATKEVDIGINTKSMSAIAMENKKHFKHGTIKEMIGQNLNGQLSNGLELDLLQQARSNVLARKQIENEVRELTNDYDNSWFVEWITNEELPKGKRDSVILKNLSILMEQGLVENETKVMNKLSEIYNTKVHSLVGQWRRWAKGKYFSIGEIITFCDDFGYDFGEVRRKYLNYDGEKKAKAGNFKIIKRSSDESKQVNKNRVVRKFN